MKKLFLSLLLAAISVTSIKPAEQAEIGKSCLEARYVGAAAIVGLGIYGWATGAREKKKRLKGQSQPRCRQTAPGAGRWHILEFTSISLCWINTLTLLLLGADTLISGALGSRSLSPTIITINPKPLLLSLVPLFSIAHLAGKRSAKFEQEYLDATCDS